MTDPSGNPSAEHLIRSAREALAKRPADIEPGALLEELWALDKWNCAERLAGVLIQGADVNAAWDDYERMPKGALSASISGLRNYDSVLLNAVLAGWSLECIALLLVAGAKVDTYDGNNQSALTNAALKGNLTLVEMMRHIGVPVDTPAGIDQTALMCAAQRGHRDLVRYLVEQGARTIESVNCCKSGGR